MKSQTRHLAFIFLILSLVLVGRHVKAQVSVSGVILDSKTSEPLMYANIQIKNSHQGAITNEDGLFNLTCLSSDTLLVSYLSFEKKEVPVAYFKEQKKCFLTPSINQLDMVIICDNYDFLFDVISAARKQLKQKSATGTKTYFSLETNSENTPVELLECYYNAMVDPTGIKKLRLKNGRIGMGSMNGSYFVSLSTTQIISDYNLLDGAYSELPLNPLHFSKNKMQKKYVLRLVSLENGLYQIKFTPSKGQDNLYSGYMWIDKDNNNIVEIKLFQNNIKTHPFVEIDKSHTIDSLNFAISYSFANTEAQDLQKIEFEYSFNYDNSIEEKEMTSSGVFLFYDKKRVFDLPYYLDNAGTFSDYDLIVSQPYNELFWRNNEVLSPSKKVLDYRDFFKKYGVLVNFNELSKHNDIFKNHIIAWSQDRIHPSRISKKRPLIESTHLLNTNMPTQSDLYNLSALIYLDRNTFGDSTFYIAQTLINLRDSYFNLERKKNLMCFMNISFDIVEMAKRDLMGSLKSKNWTKHQVDSIYNSTQTKLSRELKRFALLSNYGEDEKQLQKYVKKVQENLGIDNGILIEIE